MIIGHKVCLGPLLHADTPAVFNWLNTLALAYLNGPYRPTDQISFDGWLSSLGKDRSRVVFAIRSHGDLRLMGYVQVVNIHPVFRSGELGILIGDERDRGKGCGLEAVRLMLGHCWNDLNLNRVTLYVYGDNPRAVHVYRKAGFEDEGRLRQAAYVDGQFVDVAVMGILRA